VSRRLVHAGRAQPLAIRSLVVGGAGLAVVPSQMVLDDVRSGRMVRLLPEWRGRRVRVHVCLTSRQHPPRASRSSSKSCARCSAWRFEAEYTGAAPRHSLRHASSSKPEAR